jgi:hypothetical protein
MSLSETAGPRVGPASVTRSRAGWIAALLCLLALAAVLTAIGLALLWLRRNPVITGWDYLGHVNATLTEAAAVRAHDWGAARDLFFLLERFEPPGLRLLGVPVALVFAHAPLTALRLSATVCFALTALVLFVGLRRIAGVAGAAAAVLALALAPVNITGAQNFMTEQVLLPCAALVLAMLAGELEADEARPSAAGVARLVVLGVALGWGTLTKLTFLPTLVLPWLGVAAYQWTRRRDGGALLLRLVLPGAMLLLIAWPAYAVNFTRYLGYARATAAGFGFGFAMWPEHGTAFAWRLAEGLSGEVFGPAGSVVILLGLLLLALAWRRAAPRARVLAALMIVSSLPSLAAYCFGHNQTDRYLVLDTLLLGAAAGIGFGAALRAAVPLARAVAALAVLAAAAELGLAWAIAFGQPAANPVLAGLAYASTRANYACDYRTLAARTPPRDGPVRIGIFGETQGVNPNDVRYGYLRAGVAAEVVQFSNSSAAAIDWTPVLRDAPLLDYVIEPVLAEGWYAGIATNRARDAFVARLPKVAEVTPMGEVSTGPAPQCAVRLFAVHPLAGSPAPRRPPLEADVFVPGWSELR